MCYATESNNDNKVLRQSLQENIYIASKQYRPALGFRLADKDETEVSSAARGDDQDCSTSSKMP